MMGVPRPYQMCDLPRTSFNVHDSINDADVFIRRIVCCTKEIGPTESLLHIYYTLRLDNGNTLVVGDIPVSHVRNVTINTSAS